MAHHGKDGDLADAGEQEQERRWRNMVVYLLSFVGQLALRGKGALSCSSVFCRKGIGRNYETSELPPSTHHVLLNRPAPAPADPPNQHML